VQVHDEKEADIPISSTVTEPAFRPDDTVGLSNCGETGRALTFYFVGGKKAHFYKTIKTKT
jgi:hypothetical protein